MYTSETNYTQADNSQFFCNNSNTAVKTTLLKKDVIDTIDDLGELFGETLILTFIKSTCTTQKDTASITKYSMLPTSIEQV